MFWLLRFKWDLFVVAAGDSHPLDSAVLYPSMESGVLEGGCTESSRWLNDCEARLSHSSLTGSEASLLPPVSAGNDALEVRDPSSDRMELMDAMESMDISLPQEVRASFVLCGVRVSEVSGDEKGLS